jgi:hypothetical protein
MERLRKLLGLGASAPEVDSESEVDCDCDFCSVVSEITPSHIVAVILSADNYADAEERATMIVEACSYAVGEAQAQARLSDPVIGAEIRALDALYAAPSFGDADLSNDKENDDDQ